MNKTILSTKLNIPKARPEVVARNRLIQHLNDGMHRHLTLISAHAGFGKTTLVSEWIANCNCSAAWLSLEERDNNPNSFLTYIIAALQTLEEDLGKEILSLLQSPQPPKMEVMLISLLNEITSVQYNFILVLDDYHAIHTQPINHALTFLLENMPPQMHLVITTREDPEFPLARLRARDQLTEIRNSDLRFNSSEATNFLNQVMNLKLSNKDIVALVTKTEGWITGLQLAGISICGHDDPSSFIKTFTGNHSFIMDYLIEEVLKQQSVYVKDFLFKTSILDRLCGSLCDAVMENDPLTGQETLEFLEKSNLFIIPLDNERRWYRYHHLFAELLKQKLLQDLDHTAGNKKVDIAQLHIRASVWYEKNNYEIEAFQHAAAAGDVERAERLLLGQGVPLHFRGAIVPVMKWLKSLTTDTMDANPTLWVMYASVLSMSSQLNEVEPKLLAAEAALQGFEMNMKTRNLVGHIAAIRAFLATMQNKVDIIISESLIALENISPNNLAVRTATTCKLGVAYERQGKLSKAKQAYTEAISISHSSGNKIIEILSVIGLGNTLAKENLLEQAFKTYQQALKMKDDTPSSCSYNAYKGLARIYYEWNDLDAAIEHIEKSTQLAKQIENVDQIITSNLIYVQTLLAKGDMDGSSMVLNEIKQVVIQHNLEGRISEVSETEVQLLLKQGNLLLAEKLADTHKLPISRARVYLSQGYIDKALNELDAFYQEINHKEIKDKMLNIKILKTVILYINGEIDKSLQLLTDNLLEAKSGRFIRTFLDEGKLMERLLIKAHTKKIMPEYTELLLNAFKLEKVSYEEQANKIYSQLLLEPLSQREIEVLKLIGQGLSNKDISERLFIALDTVKGHNRRIFDKLQVKRRTEAVAKAHEMDLL
ncbi:LuxR C-terminal-related transcriptional regulator [Chengkuizengella axinellae]|uniref:LuxR C-terminal-related transcriptional regulator n=1 Tax=Chengkuizengella axinellae TaxID=3064388 RepID=A0ABT9J523_9BACL|nr:LuxR C-terminal-related transcriptional regulator [Chengkuizengella sp. 2205SS18-9]MDP5276711.1 LuxR C-terminal-related transcriptional regulator [Chengkuizengella sp. 2205SS18-9]